MVLYRNQWLVFCNGSYLRKMGENFGSNLPQVKHKQNVFNVGACWSEQVAGQKAERFSPELGYLVTVRCNTLKSVIKQFQNNLPRYCAGKATAQCCCAGAPQRARVRRPNRFEKRTSRVLRWLMKVPLWIHFLSLKYLWKCFHMPIV